MQNVHKNLKKNTKFSLDALEKSWTQFYFSGRKLDEVCDFKKNPASEPNRQLSANKRSNLHTTHHYAI